MKQLVAVLILAVWLAADSDVTLYQHADAEIEEQRAVTLQQGMNSLAFPLPLSFKPDSLLVTIKQPEGRIVSYRTKRALTSSSQLLKMYVGKEIGFRLNEAMSEYYKGTLLSLNPVMILHDEEVYFDVRPVNIKVPYKAFSYEPEVVIQAKARKNMQGVVGLYYQVQGIHWQSRYLLEKKRDGYYLSGWAEVYNGSNDDLDVGSLKLVAGDVHRSPQQPENMVRLAKAYDAQAQRVKSDLYNIYAINSVPTLYAREVNSVELIPAHKIEADATLVAAVSNPMYTVRTKSLNPLRVIRFKATEALPSGAIEVYDADTKLMLGEDRLNNAAQNSSVEVKVGGVYEMQLRELPIKLRKEASKKSVTVEYEVTNMSEKEQTVLIKVPYLNQNNYGVTVEGALKHYFESANTLVIVAAVSKENSHTVKAEYSFPAK